MSNQRMIKSAHIWVLTVLLACGLWAIAGKAGIKIQGQNSNQNSNQNGNTNTGTQNSNTSGNTNTGATGEQAGMASMSSRDQDFLMDTAMSNLMEVALGRMAVQLGTSDAVKQFGQKMIDEHTKANTELMTLASSKGITLPTALDDKQQKDASKLQRTTGAEFDRAYAKMMVSHHKKNLSEFEKQSTRDTDPDLKAFATKTLPTLQEHLQMAMALDPTQGGGNSNSGGSSNKNNNSNSNSNRP